MHKKEEEEEKEALAAWASALPVPALPHRGELVDEALAEALVGGALEVDEPRHQLVALVPVVAQRQLVGKHCQQPLCR